MDTGTIRVGFVGLGNIAHYHATRLRSLATEVGEAVELVGGMDVQQAARESFGAEFGVPTFEVVEELFERADAVVVTTPNRFHEEYTVRALDAGLSVLVEKPLAHTLESAERVVAAADRSPGVCMVGFHKRFADPVEVLASKLDADAFGDLTHVEANFVRRRGIPGRGSWFTTRSSAGGGALVDIGAHAIDLAMYLLGYPDLREVSGVTRSEFGVQDDYAYLEMWGEDGGGPFDVDDSASAFVRCANGATISLEVAWASNREPTNELVLRGTEAGATYDHETEEVTIHRTAADGASHFADTAVTTRSTDAHRAEQRYFLDCVREGRRPDRNTPEQALTVQRIIDAIYRSSEAGRAVRFDEHGPVDGSGGDTGSDD